MHNTVKPPRNALALPGPNKILYNGVKLAREPFCKVKSCKDKVTVADGDLEQDVWGELRAAAKVSFQNAPVVEIASAVRKSNK